MKTVLSGTMGFGLGGLFGLFMASVCFLLFLVCLLNLLFSSHSSLLNCSTRILPC